MEPLRPTDPSHIGGYRLLRRLGAGGMGVVYLGRSPGGGLVAIKVILADRVDDPSFRVRFRREVAAARRVHSPWAAAVTDAETESDTPWLATAYVPGPALGEAVAAFGPLAEPYARQLGVRLAEALAAVHAADLVHRDVKPGNILLALDGPRLIDFGIARSAQDTALTGLNMVIGSPGFLSPEQARAHGPVVGPASDVFSLGCVLVFATSGRRPFGAGSPAAMLYRTVHAEAELRGVPEGLLPLLGACLDKDPARRPTAAELGERLAVGLPGEGEPWLPEPVIRLIAGRSTELLALPAIEATVQVPGEAAQGAAQPPAAGTAAAGAAGAAGVDADADAGERPGAAGPGRRRLLAFASAGGVLAAGGLGTWAALRGDGGRGTGARAGGVPRHTIGLHADLSGPGAALGRALERGAQLAVTEFNARTDRPFTLALRARDDAGRLDRAREVARQLGADKGVLAVIGPTSDAAASAVAGPYRTARLAVVSVSLGADAVAHVEYRNYLASRSADTRLILPLLAQVARRTRQHDRARGTVVGIIDDRNAGELSWQAAQDFATALTNNTYPTPPRTVTVARGATDVRAPVAELLAYRVDAIAYLGLLPGAVAVARELRRVGFDGDRLALQPVREPRFLREAGAAADGWYVSSAFVDASAYARTKAFAAGYRSRYGTAPPRYAAEAYDVVGLVARGLRDVAGTGAEREALIGRLPRTVYRGITKEFRFEPDSGTVSEAGLYLSRVVDGRFRFLGSYEEATKSRGG